MASKTQTKTQELIADSTFNGNLSSDEFDRWVKAVKQQMVAALRKRGNC